jgi:hypothetical protein
MARTILVGCVDDRRGIWKDEEAMGHKARGQEELPCAMLVVG